MSQRLTIALDAMGGDLGPDMVVAGADIARERHPDVRFLLYGDQQRLEPLLSQRPALKAVAEIRHTADFVAGDAKPAVALRAGRQSSMRLAIDAVAAGEAACVVSAGNTGALMAMAKFVLKTLPGIDRPAMASFFPTQRGESVMLDLGANAECQPENLVQFAVMGAVFARAILGLPEPSIGVLNIGSEDMKGNEVVRAAAASLRDMPLPGRFHGFVEGTDIGLGTVDVIVTDGFTGNVALKTAEGTAKLFSEFLRRTFATSFLARIGYLLARGAFKRFRERIDPRRYNGAMFLGLRGVCVKSHGGTDAVGFANAVAVAVNLATHGFNERIKEEMGRIADANPLPDTKAAAG
ncbi:phosphate acyltransferase PlsX [Azospirillum oryzae]|uniref:Phosphate acyltransferase n=1 Tax=Azospirillum oryzae TaxID=286727 RepID=A0A6N1AX96_9PROT|nr:MULTISPECIES: phosphate acyltransferase PlsX [Azospirillum]KAA0572770.1 phosphate acyltransferase PlsX [Azospirillum sp. Sh1]KAA0591194.1 phosphate acyltransferase PlsX [Azospirillum oryzae]QKS52482.1 phosphate acyltransferase PlsX [Azospirillum oryzae]GLR80614.1 phosphate acyltransferase [Azospirillum oryzae]